MLLADDYPAIMRTLERLLRKRYDVVGQVTNGVELVEAARNLQPDLVIVDLNMPDMGGLEACRRIKRELPHTKVIVLSAAGDEAVAEGALKVGASAFVVKYRLAQDLLPAIEQLLNG